MGSVAKIFKEKLVANHLAKFSRDDISDFDRKRKIISRWQKSCMQGDLNKTKETEIQGAFMMQVFDQVLGYTSVTSTDTDYYHQKQEYNSALDASEADGGLGYFSMVHKVKDIRAVVELKDATTDLDKKQNRSSHLTPVEQAFFYANKNGSKCGWVIVSNFIEIRLYKSNSMLEYEVFDIRKMDSEEEFLRFYFFLCKDHLISQTGKSKIDTLYQENEEMGVAISNDFYKTYKRIRNNLYVSLKENNPDKDELLLFTKSQKIMDRFIFICFCEDCGLLPSKIFQRLIDSAKNSFSFSPTKLWDELRGLFRAIDLGSPPMQINRYNGGLFKTDPDLDSLVILDDVLIAFSELSTYDFSSDLNVNILGQIFEQSISDVEQIKSEIAGESTAAEGKGKQKDDGIFYTPYYVTRYIVEQTVGAYLSGRKEALKKAMFIKGPFKAEVYKVSTKRKITIELKSWVEIPDAAPNMTEAEEMQREAIIKLHQEYWTEYEEVLRSVKICDPACGSGAFLNQCFDFLHEEMNFVLDMKHQFDEDKASYSLFDIDKQILQNNLFGVDINPESVEITKLSLWLKTAKQNQTLASLDDNIKCGNSIVDDPAVAGSLAFNWQEQFPMVFANGGFDVIVGNPPYGATVELAQKDYINNKYSTAEGNFDTYRIFFELGFDILKPNGYLGYITPNTYFDLKRSGTKLRQFLFAHTLLKIVEVYNVFPNAVVEPVISIYQKKQDDTADLEIILVPRNTKLTSTFIADGVRKHQKQAVLKKNEDLTFNYKTDASTENVIDAVKSIAKPITEYYFVYNGAKPYEVGKGTPPQTKEITKNKIYNGYTKVDDTWLPYMRGKRIYRFTTMWDGDYIKYGKNLAAPRSPDIFFREKIFVRQTGDSIVATLDTGNVSNDTLHIIFSKDNQLASNKYLLGLLNSKFMSWFYQAEHPTEVGKPMAQVKKAFVEELPLVVAEKDVVCTVEQHVDRLLSLCQTRQQQKQKFLSYIKSAYEPKSISERLEEYADLTFKEFVAELKKQKVKLSASQQMDLLSLFDEQKATVSNLSAQIMAVQTSLDDLVFAIYQIPADIAATIRSSMQITL